jgi:hypothetical protein
MFPTMDPRAIAIPLNGFWAIKEVVRPIRKEAVIKNKDCASL